MKIAITGALGHIGSAFIHSLKPSDFESVLLIDDLSAQRYCSLFNLPKGVNFTFVEADICSADLEKLFHGVDVVIHLAAVTNALESVKKEEIVEKINFYGTKRVAQACLTTGARMIFPSSTSVYNSKSEVVTENSEVLGQSPYAVFKLKAEQYLIKTMKKKGLKFTVFRFGTIFGPSAGMRFHTAVNKFIWQACNGQYISVWETALHQKRPYLSVNDAVGAIKFVIQKNEFKGKIYNVVSVNATVYDIIEQIKKWVPYVHINLVSSPIMNTLSYKVSDQKIRSLGFTKRHSLEQGIYKSIFYLRRHYMGIRSKILWDRSSSELKKISIQFYNLSQFIFIPKKIPYGKFFHTFHI